MCVKKMTAHPILHPHPHPLNPHPHTIDGEFLGSELACALGHRAKERAKNGKASGKIIQLMPEKGEEKKLK
jgi:hypothetical protein